MFPRAQYVEFMPWDKVKSLLLSPPPPQGEIMLVECYFKSPKCLKMLDTNTIYNLVKMHIIIGGHACKLLHGREAPRTFPRKVQLEDSRNATKCIG